MAESKPLLDIPLRPASSLGLGYQKFLIHGVSGAGKTALGAEAPNPIILLTEMQGLATVLTHNPSATVVPIESVARKLGVSEMDVVRDLMQRARLGQFPEGSTIVLDTADELMRIMKDDMQQGEEFTLQQWGGLTDRFRRFLRLFRDIPYNAIMLTHTDVTTEGEENLRYLTPAFLGRQIGPESPGYFSAVGWMFKRYPSENDKKAKRGSRRGRRDKDDAKDEEATGDEEATVVHLVMFDGPSRYAVKPTRPLRALEEPDVTDWLRRITEYRAELQTRVVDPVADGGDVDGPDDDPANGGGDEVVALTTTTTTEPDAKPAGRTRGGRRGAK